MIIKYNKLLMTDGQFHSEEMDMEEFIKLIKDFVADIHPDDEIESIDMDDKNLIDIKLKSGEEIEIEVDWNELVLK